MDDADFPFEVAPADIAELAESCRAYALRTVGVELDYAPETLPVLDEYLRTARPGVAERPELADLIIRSAGAYFGEVVRREIDGFWREAGADAARWQLCGRRAFLCVNPAKMVAAALGLDTDPSEPDLRLAPEDRQTVERRLQALPGVSDEDFRLLSTRLEAIEIAVAALREEMVAEGLADVIFGVSDYD